MLDSGGSNLVDFYFTGHDYRYRFEPEAKQRFLDLLRERFNSAVSYRGRALKWDTVIEQKTAELGRYLVGAVSRLDFDEPWPDLHRMDDRGVRRQILGLSQSEALRRRIRKSTLHYLRKKAKDQRSFKMHSEVRQKLQNYVAASMQEVHKLKCR